MKKENEQLAERVRPSFLRLKGFSEKKMFGGICFLIHGKICVGAWKGSLLARIDRKKHDEVMREPFVKPMDMTGRIMKGWVRIQPAGISDDEDLKQWIARSIAYVRSLPSKP